jgi:hypothetical protein
MPLKGQRTQIDSDPARCEQEVLPLLLLPSALLPVMEL